MSDTETTIKRPRGPELLCAAVNQILAHPETWNQRSWHCGTKHCIFGHCQIIGTGRETSDPSIEVQGLLGISAADRYWLSDARRSLTEIYGFAKTYRDGFDRAGFDRDGFNRDGFNRDGFNRDGFDRAGFDRDGFDRDGKKIELVPFEL